MMESNRTRVRFARLKRLVGPLLCCLILAMGVRNVASAVLKHADHPGWDFVLRHGEVSCLMDLRVDPYDIFSGAVRHERFLPYYLDFKNRDDSLEYHWCYGYPPWEYTLLLPLAFLSVQRANAIFVGLEFASIALVVLFSLHRVCQIRADNWKRLLIASAFFLLPPEAWDVAFRFDNWTILFCAGSVCLIVCLEKKWDVLAGLAWAFLMIKPQQGIWFAVPILFRRQFKTFCVAVATCLAASIPPAILCGKSPISLILEIPRFRLQPFVETSLFPSPVYSFASVWFFPKAALFSGLLACFAFTLWATWKLRKEKDWFVVLQPTFFCICAGYPLWRQDWLFYFFPIVFLLETWARPSRVPFRIRTFALLLAIALANPLSWCQYNAPWSVGTLLTNAEVVAYSTWVLFAFLAFFVQTQVYSLGRGQEPNIEVPTAVDSPSSALTMVPLFLLLATFLGGLVYVAFLKNGSILGIDAAHIFFGYAENLCQGRGITYAGNGVHCEGTTSILWLLLCSLCFQLHLGEPGVFVLSIVLLLGAQWLWLQILDAILPSRNRSPAFFFVYVVMVLSSAGYVTWMSITLMDTVLWGFLVAWMTLVLQRGYGNDFATFRRRILSAVPFAFAPWSQPEAILVVPCGVVLSALFRRSRGRDIRNEFVWLSVFLLSLVVLTGFRLSCFGYPFPNSTNAKVSSSFVSNVQKGTEYLFGYIQSGVFPYLTASCFVIVVLLMLFRTLRGRMDAGRGFSKFVFLWLWGFILVLPPVFSGGDHFGYGRCFQPIWPLFCVLLVSTFASLPVLKWFRPVEIDWARTIALFAFVIFAFFARGKKWGNNPRWMANSPIIGEFSIAQTGLEQGRMLSRIFTRNTEKPVLGVMSAGGISRTYMGQVVDLTGLNNDRIAPHPENHIGTKNHAAFEPELFSSLKIDLMPFEPTPFISRTLKGMLETESFVESWRCGRIRKNDTEVETPPFFVEKKFLDRLLSTGDFSFSDSYQFKDGAWKEIKEPADTE